MVGILLVTHGRFSQGIAESVHMLLGEQEKFSTLCLREDDDIDTFYQSMSEAIGSLDDGSGVLVLVDVLGGSPCNTAARFLREKKIESLTGLNFPMLIKAFETREQMGLSELKKVCLDTAREGIIDVRDYMGS